jgi:hypothetical protein
VILGSHNSINLAVMACPSKSMTLWLGTPTSSGDGSVHLIVSGVCYRSEQILAISVSTKYVIHILEIADFCHGVIWD